MTATSINEAHSAPILMLLGLGPILLILPFGNVFAQVSNDGRDTSVDSSDNLPPLRASTAFENYMVELDWEPKSIGIDNETTFTVRILDKSGVPMTSEISYDFLVSASDLSPISEFYNQTTDGSGVGKPITVQFENEGPVEITVWVNPPDVQGDIDSESATFDLMVAPEFPVVMPILALAGIGIAIIVFVTRIRMPHDGTTI
jgi:hypothetical protein